MKRNVIDGAVLFVMKAYHEIFDIVLKDRKQTQAEAAMELGISVSTFQKMYRLKGVPDFNRKKGKDLEEKLEMWTGVSIKILFPEAYFTKEFFEGASKTYRASHPFQLIMKWKAGVLTLAPPTFTKPPKQSGVKKKRKKRKK